MTTIDHHGISVLREFYSINYCDFHDHGIMTISIYCPTLSRTN